MHLAAQEDHGAVVELLLKNGADQNAIDSVRQLDTEIFVDIEYLYCWQS